MTIAGVGLDAKLNPLAGPFLFVGSGLSRRFLGLPDWQGLLRHFADETAHPFEYYRGLAGNDLPQTASLIAAEFYDVWWSSPKYASSVTTWKSTVTNSAAVLKIEVAAYIEALSTSVTLPPLEQSEYAALQKVVVEGVITTNYDSLVEQAFPTFRTFLGQDGLLLSDTQQIAEIYLIHGSTKEPASLILTADDYDDFNNRNAYLAAKLLTIFVEHPVVFLGYSFSDPNVRAILASLVRGLRGKSSAALKDKLIFVEWEPGATPTVTDAAIEVDSVFIPIVRLIVPDFVEVFAVLAKRDRKLSARTLRILKEQMFEIVKHNDPTGRLFGTTEIDDPTAVTDFVFGVGAKMTAVGVVGLNRFDLMDDVLASPERDLPADKVVQQIIGKTAITVYIPMYKYLGAMGYLAEDGSRADSGVTIPARVLKRIDKFDKLLGNVATNADPRPLRDLEASHGWEWVLNHALELHRYTLDVDGIRDFLVAQRSVRNRSWFSTQYAKLCVMYDWLRFGPGQARWS